MIYLDNSSTTRQYDEVTEKMANVASETFGNPSSLHRLGLKAEEEVKTARKYIAKAIGCSDDEIYFTSCGTESDSTAILGTVEKKAHQKNAGKKIISTAVEHPAILEPLKKLEKEGYEIVLVGVDKSGNLKLDELKNAVDENTILISVMTVNNESGAIMPIREIAEFKNEFNKIHGTDIWLHTDCVQALGKVDLRKFTAKGGVDMLSCSAHKIHGPKGMGFLYIRKGIDCKPFLLGGGQEKGFRSGTENVAGIAGFGLACKIAYDNFEKRISGMSECHQYLLDGLRKNVPDIVINSPEDGCCSVLNVSFMGTRGEVLLHTLEQDEIYVSTGSACSSNHSSKNGSHVLNAMGKTPKEIEGAIRFSFNEFNTVEEMDFVTEKVSQAVQKFRRLGAFR